MLEIFGDGQRWCDRITRRTMLRVGALAPIGLSLPSLLAANEDNPAGAVLPGFGRAKRCLMLFMWGGPAHQDTYDLKPDAPAGIRSEFKPIATNVPGIQLCEHMSAMARHADKLAIVRSVTHSDNNHSTSAHWMLTGRKHRLSAENFNASSEDFPHVGSVITKLAPVREQLPTFVALPERISTTAGPIVPGQDGGVLGKRYSPFRIDEHPDEPEFNVRRLRLPDGVDPVRVRARRSLLATIDEAHPLLDHAREVEGMDAYYQQAMDLITSPAARQAFDLGAEPDRIRDRYGRGTFGQGLLLARRLLEAGVKLVTVYWHRDKPGVDTTWDTHKDNFTGLKDRLLPQVDGPIASLLQDLSDRGLLDDTLIFWNSEFGRTPNVNRNAGRDHWGACNSIWFAGAVPGGLIHGASDKKAAFPLSDPVAPADLSATVFHLMGLDPSTIVYDQQHRPIPISEGTPIAALLGSTT